MSLDSLFLASLILYLWHPHTYTHQLIHAQTHSRDPALKTLDSFHCAQSQSWSLHAYWMTSVYIWSPTTELCVALTKGMPSFSFFFNVLVLERDGNVLISNRFWDFLVWKHIAFLLIKALFSPNNNTFFYTVLSSLFSHLLKNWFFFFFFLFGS